MEARKWCKLYIYYPFIIGLSLENRLAAFKECAKLGLAICVRSLLFFNFLVGGKFKHVEKNVCHLLSEKSTSELILVTILKTLMWKNICHCHSGIQFIINSGHRDRQMGPTISKQMQKPQVCTQKSFFFFNCKNAIFAW